MDISVVANWGEVISAIAVVISVLYLAMQVRQGNKQSASEAGFAIVAEMSRFDEFVFSNPEVARFMVKLKNDDELN